MLRLNTGLCDCTLPLLAAAPVVRLPDHVHHYASRLPGALLPHKARRHLHGGAILLQAQPFDVCVRADAIERVYGDDVVYWYFIPVTAVPQCIRQSVLLT